MIVNKYANGGGSGSGSTDLSGYWNSAETQVHIDSAVTPVSEHLFDVEQVTASALTELHDGLLEVSARTVDMSGYYTSAQTDEKIASAASITYASAVSYTDAALADFSLDGYYTSAQTDAAIALAVAPFYTSAQTEEAITNKNYVTSAETEAQILGKNYVTSGEVETQITGKNYITAQALTAYTPTSGFSTINGSAITNGGNLVIQSPDMSEYYTSAQTEEAITSKNYVNSGQVKSQVEAYNYVTSAETEEQILSKNYTTSAETKVYVDSAVTGAQDQIDTLDEVVSRAILDLNERVDAISGSTPGGDLSNYWNSAQTQDAISAATQDMVTSTDVRHIVKLTQAQYDALVDKDPETFYIIVNSI